MITNVHISLPTGRIEKVPSFYGTLAFTGIILPYNGIEDTIIVVA